MSTFYRKYRPQRFAEVIGQEPVVRTLTNSLRSNRLAHAYLFTGPRGTGKTTLARLFAQAANCLKRKGAEPCGTCLPCTLQKERRTLDVIEIDAASHTGVDHMRELKETVHLPPTAGSHKVYIIDEAHMLSLGAWNALLKTLEEPPAHVIFLLATTRVDKVPETILSRAIRFDLARFPVESIVEKLERIARSEKIKITRPALLLIARSAEGGMRDAEVLFTRIATLEESPIAEDRVALLLGATSTENLAQLATSLADQDLVRGLSIIQSLKKTGVHLPQLALAFLQYLRALLFFSLDQKQAATLTADMTEEEKRSMAELAGRLGSERLILCLERFQEATAGMRDTPIPELPLEIALAKLITTPPESTASTADSSTAPTPTSPVSATKEKNAPTASAKTKDSVTRPSSAHRKHQASPPSPAAPQGKVSGAKGPAPDLAIIRERWPAIVALAKDLNASVAVALSATTPLTIEGHTLILQARYPFHQERLEVETNRLTLDKAFDTILGFRPRWKVQVEAKTKATIDTGHPPLIDQALDILGGKLVQNES